MLMLGIETSCDETAAAVVEERGDAAAPWRVRSNVVASQARSTASGAASSRACVSAACARHLRRRRAGAERRRRRPWTMSDAVAVTQGPGLVGSLLVGVSFAKSLAAARGLPLVPVHHLAGHIESLFLQNGAAAAAGGRARRLRRPHEPVSRAVTWASTSCSAARAMTRRARRSTRSRSCSASAIPAGRSSIASRQYGNDRAVELPVTRITHADRNAARSPGALDFSYSGLKTAVRRHVAARQASGHGCHRVAKWPTSARASSASSSSRSSTGCSRRRGRSAPPVSASPAACRPTAGCARMRWREGEASGLPVFVPSLALSTDNAAMIAAAGLRRLHQGVVAGPDLNADASLVL